MQYPGGWGAGGVFPADRPVQNLFIFLFWTLPTVYGVGGVGGGTEWGEEKRTPNTPGCSVVILRTEHLADRQELGA